MINAGEVGALFKIQDQVTPVITRLVAEFNRLQLAVDRTQLALDKLKMPRGMTAALNRMAAGLQKVDAQAGLTAATVAASFGRMDASITATQAAVTRLATSIRGVGVSSRALGGGGGGGGGGHSLRSGGFHMNRGVALPGGVHGSANSSSDGFWPFVMLAAAGDAFGHIVAEGGEFEKQKKLLRDRLGANGTEADVQGAIKAAIGYSTGGANSVIGSTPAGALQGITELLSVTPNLKAAEDLYGPMMRAAKVLEELTKQPAAETMKTLAKGIENTGGGIDPTTGELSPGRMQDAVNAAVKTLVAGGGFIDANALFGYAKQAGGMGRITTNLDAAQDQIITALIDMGGQRTGTAMAALGRQFLGGKMTKPTADSLEELGILPKGGWKKSGVGVSLLPGYEMKGADEIKDPQKGMGQWLVDVWGPAVKDKLLRDGKEINVANIMEESFKDFGQQTGQRLGLMFLMNKSQQDRDIAIRHGVNPASAYSGIGEKDLGANLDAVAKAWQGFAQVVGGPSTEAAIAGLHGLTGAMQEMTKVAALSPKADKYGVELGIGGTALGLLSKISGWLGGPTLSTALKGGLGLANLPGAIDAVTDDNRSPRAKANDDAVISWLKGLIFHTDVHVTMAPNGTSTQTSTTRIINGPSTFDGRAAPAYPDHVY